MAERGGARWAVELRASSRPLREDGSFDAEGGPALPYPTLESYLALCWREKRGQLEATMAAEGCARGLLAVSVTGARGDAWERALARAYVEAASPASVCFGLLWEGGLVAFPAV